MFAARVVESVDVFEEGGFDLSAGLPVAPPDQFSLQRLEEAFDGRIVIAVAFPAHRNLEPVLAQQLLIVVGTVLRSAICVVDAAGWRPSNCDRHVQCPERQILLHAVADGPADHSARKQINDYSQINPPLPRPDIGDVTCPLLVRPACAKVLLQEIRRDVEDVIAVRSRFEFASPNDLYAILAHQSPDTALADADAQFVQLLGHARPAVAAQAQAVLVADMGQEHPITPLAMRGGPVLPGMEPAL